MSDDRLDWIFAEGDATLEERYDTWAAPSYGVLFATHSLADPRQPQ